MRRQRPPAPPLYCASDTIVRLVMMSLFYQRAVPPSRHPLLTSTPPAGVDAGGGRGEIALPFLPRCVCCPPACVVAAGGSEAAAPPACPALPCPPAPPSGAPVPRPCSPDPLPHAPPPFVPQHRGGCGCGGRLPGQGARRACGRAPGRARLRPRGPAPRPRVGGAGRGAHHSGTEARRRERWAGGWGEWGGGCFRALPSGQMALPDPRLTPLSAAQDKRCEVAVWRIKRLEWGRASVDDSVTTSG